MNTIEMKNVSFVRQGKPILTDINWTVKPGENWAILGLNGSGKSSLLKLIMAENWKTSGDLSVLGTRFGLDQIPELRSKIGIVGSFIAERFRGDVLAEKLVLTGKFNSAMLFKPFSEAELDEARDLMRQVGAEKLIGRIYGTLSQGEKQLLLIARSLIIQPQLLILDEATNGLDLFAKEELLTQLHAICELPDAPTLLYITHHPDEIISDFKKILLLREGQVFDSGDTSSILTTSSLTDFYQRTVTVEHIKKRYFIIP